MPDSSRIDPHTSRAIYWLQVVLAFMVVGIHTAPEVMPGSPMDYVARFIHTCITLPVLATYFLLAGYLMFARFDTFGVAEYRYVVTRRLATLVIPWLLWAIIGYLAYVILEPSRPAPPFWRLDRIIWAQEYSQPLVIGDNVSIPLLGTPFGCGVMYCVRDIFIFALLSPLVWWTVRRLRLWTIALMVAAFFLIGRPGIGAWHLNWMFFPIGAALSICRFDLARFCRRLGWPVVILWIIMTLACTWMYVNFDSNHMNHGLYSRLFIIATDLVGITSLLILAHKATYRRDSWLMMLVPFTFFIFAIHVLPIVEKPLEYAIDLTNGTLGVAPEWQPVTFIIYMIPVRIALIIGLATLIGRLSPRLLSLLTGTRSQKPELPATRNPFSTKRDTPKKSNPKKPLTP